MQLKENLCIPTQNNHELTHPIQRLLKNNIYSIFVPIQRAMDKDIQMQKLS